MIPSVIFVVMASRSVMRKEKRLRHYLMTCLILDWPLVKILLITRIHSSCLKMKWKGSRKYIRLNGIKRMEDMLLICHIHRSVHISNWPSLTNPEKSYALDIIIVLKNQILRFWIISSGKGINWQLCLDTDPMLNTERKIEWQKTPRMCGHLKKILLQKYERKQKLMLI